MRPFLLPKIDLMSGGINSDLRHSLSYGKDK